MKSLYDSPHPEFEALWQKALAELRFKMCRSTFDSRLAGSSVLATASTRHFWVIVVPSHHAWEWVTFRLLETIELTLFYVVGWQIKVCALLTTRIIMSASPHPVTKIIRPYDYFY